MRGMGVSAVGPARGHPGLHTYSHGGVLVPFSAIIVLAFVALSGLFALGRAAKADAAEFSLAGRRLSGLALFATLAASNLSAFTVFGVSGASYRLGWAFFPVMAFGTAFMALSFAYIGVPLRRLAAEGSWITPGDFISARFGSVRLGRLFSALSLGFTLPYLAIQASSGGRLIAGATGLSVPLSSALLVAVVGFYVFKGGLKAVVKTDIAQLAALLVLGLAAAAIIVAAALKPDTALLVASDNGAAARAGSDGSLNWTALAGYYLLWSLADPMFPHFMQRFFAAKSDAALLKSMAAYPFVLIAVFLPMSAIGVLGRALAPGLSAAQSDGVFTLLTERLAGPVLAPIFSIAALAALMSTMDSQLLSCASMLSADILPKRGDGARRTALAGAVLALAAWLVSLRPPEAMLSFLNRAAFPGYASLAPVALAALYAPGVGAAGATAALAAGALLVLLQSSGVFMPPLPAVFFNAGIQALILAAAWLWRRHRPVSPGALSRPRGPAASPPPFSRGWSLAFLALLMAGLDFWSFMRYGWERRGFLSLPYWLWYQLAAASAVGAVFYLYARRERAGLGRRPYAK
jgi:solute:Na+ symporter, SSS family